MMVNCEQSQNSIQECIILRAIRELSFVAFRNWSILTSRILPFFGILSEANLAGQR
jgi:hypothetical protein